MGHGASSNIKTVTINARPAFDSSGWTRSNSDGCIVESNLNSSKTKIDLLDQQQTELKKLLQTTEEKLKESENKNAEIQNQMAEVEGTNFELRDKVLELEQMIESLQAQLAHNQEQDLTGTLEAKDLYIEQLESEAKNHQEQIDKLKLKCRKRLNNMKTQLAEVKQEGSLNLYKLKQEIVILEEENYKLTSKLDRASSASKRKQLNHEDINKSDDITDWEDSRTKVILQLSTQLSVQQEKIYELEMILEEKERLIKEHTKSLRHKSDSLKEISHRYNNLGLLKAGNNDIDINNLDSENHQGTEFAQKWHSLSDASILTEDYIEPSKKYSENEDEVISCIQSPSSTKTVRSRQTPSVTSVGSRRKTSVTSKQTHSVTSEDVNNKQAEPRHSISATSVCGRRTPSSNSVGSGRTPSATSVGSRRTPSVNSTRTLSATSVGSRRTPSANSVDSRQTPSANSVDSRQTPSVNSTRTLSATSVDSRRTPSANSVGSVLTSSASSITIGSSDISIPDNSSERRRKRRNQVPKTSTRKMSAESYDSGVYPESRNGVNNIKLTNKK